MVIKIVALASWMGLWVYFLKGLSGGQGFHAGSYTHLRTIPLPTPSKKKLHAFAATPKTGTIVQLKLVLVGSPRDLSC